MSISRNKMYELFNMAFERFLIKDASSIRNNASERHLCARLGFQFEFLLANYDLEAYYADPEYNRKQNGRIKTILSGAMEVVPITCDLILHSRGENERDNLIAMEMAKPDKTTEQIHSDRLRLMALTKSSFDDVWSYDGKVHPEHVCGYLLGAFIMIESSKSRATVEFFVNGVPTTERAEFFLDTD